MIALLLIAAQAVAPAPAAPPAAVAQDAIDLARLKAARDVIDLIMPPERREAMIEGMLRPMMANLQQSMMSNPSFKSLFDGNAKASKAFDKFMTERNERTIAMLRKGLPGMIDAMTRAYARRFTPEQLTKIGAFFATPTGRVYMDQGMTIMADPDVQAWQRKLMTDSMGDVQQDIGKLVTELEATDK